MESSGAEAKGGGTEAVTAELAALLARLTELATAPEPDPHCDPAADTARIDQMALLERIKAASAAAQHTKMVGFARSQVEQQIANDALDPRLVGRGIGDQIGLACKVSPFTGSRRLGVARALHAELPATRALLAAGLISEDIATLVVAQTSHLDAEQRRLVDKQLAEAGLERLSPLRAAALAKRYAYQADPAGYVARGRTARKDRRVTLRPAPDTMTLLSGLLPVEQGVACLAALRKHTDEVIGKGDGRTRDQVMADTLVERLTGQAHAADVNVEVGIVIPVDALLHPEQPDRPDDDTDHREHPEQQRRTDHPSAAGPTGTAGSAEVTGFGPIPAGIARDILAATQGKRWWRRLFTHPDNLVVGGDPRRRRFDGFLAHLIGIRDGGRCRDPYCDAPIRHLDHIQPHRAGGPTNFANGRGVCARGNYVREMPGWRVELVDHGLASRPHTVRTTTPTGHTYISTAGPAP
jgi:hypothetical protein